MSDIIEGIGGAVEGALFGRAVEGKDGVTKAHASDKGARECPNCGAISSTPYCPACGQKRDLHRTLGALLHDLIHGVLHLDGKFWNTIPLLIFKPGQLTRRYIDGERAKFVSPMAMFLFSVFAMFAIFQMVGLTTPTNIEDDTRTFVTGVLENETKAVTDKIAEVDEELAKPDTSSARRVALEAERTTLERDLALLENRGQNLAQVMASGQTEFLDGLEEQGEQRISEAKERLATLPEESPERANLEAEIAAAEDGLSNLREFEESTGGGLPFVDSSNGTFTMDKTGVGLIDTFAEKWQSNPSLMLYKLQANAYKFSWLLIPLSIPFVWMVFAWKRRFKAYDHAIFVTYSLSFISLLFITVSLLFLVEGLGPIAGLMMALIPPIHLYKQLRHTYDLSRFSAFWRLLALSAFIWIVLVLFLQLLLLIGAF